MKRENLEHIIRASSNCVDIKEIYIMGSQAILGEHPELGEQLISTTNVNFKLVEKPERILLVSDEADILIPDDYRKAETIEGSIGEYTPFHETYGYYAQAIDETTCKLPEGWRSRVVDICNANTNHITGHCLETHDLIISKLIAGREKDLLYFKAACQLNLVKKDILLKRLDNTSQISDTTREQVRSIICRELKNEPSRKIR